MTYGALDPSTPTRFTPYIQLQFEVVWYIQYGRLAAEQIFIGEL